MAGARVSMDSAVRVLILGMSGMLGHKLAQVLPDSGHEVFGSLRPNRHDTLVAAGFPADRLVCFPGPITSGDLEGLLARLHPHVLVNCVGIVKQSEAAQNPVLSMEINSVFPHMVGGVCAAAGVRMIQISTDCVFSGHRGGYAETCTPDPVDFYGASKLLGEVTYAPHVTIRTSMIGRELFGSHGLVEWFLGAGGDVPGYRNAVFSGLTTLEISNVVEQALHVDDLTGLYHLASEPIDKYTLLGLLDEAFGTGKRITADDGLRLDRSLDGRRLADRLSLAVPDWPTMVSQLARDADTFDYAAFRRSFARIG